jgi:hypothetical protein
MSIIVNSTQEPQCPAGIVDAVFSRVEDLGLTTGKWGVKDQIRVEFTTAHLDTNGRPIKISKRLNKVMSKGSGMRALFKALCPNTPIPKAVDWESLLNRRCLLNIFEHVDEDGIVWANIGRGKEEPGFLPLSASQVSATSAAIAMVQAMAEPTPAPVTTAAKSARAFTTGARSREEMSPQARATADSLRAIVARDSNTVS